MILLLESNQTFLCDFSIFPPAPSALRHQENHCFCVLRRELNVCRIFSVIIQIIWRLLLLSRLKTFLKHI